MGRLLYIGMIVILGITFVVLTFVLYYAYKKIKVNGKSMLEEPINENTRTDKIGAGEIFVYALMFFIAIIFALQILYKSTGFASVTAILIRTIILVPIMALFNARKRTGKSMVTLFASMMFLLFCTMAYMIIGLPVKAPVLTIDDTRIILGQTTVKEIMDAGFDIYVEKDHVTKSDYMEFSKSDVFEKYDIATELSLPKGYHRYTPKEVFYSKGILVKGNDIVAQLTFYGSMTQEMKLKDCSLIYFYMQKDYILKARENKVSMTLDGIDLFSKLEMEKMKKNFGGNLLWRDWEEDRHYVISLRSNSEHLFYDSYVAIVHVDDEYLMNSLEMECQIAREYD